MQLYRITKVKTTTTKYTFVSILYFESMLMKHGSFFLSCVVSIILSGFQSGVELFILHQIVAQI